MNRTDISILSQVLETTESTSKSHYVIESELAPRVNPNWVS